MFNEECAGSRRFVEAAPGQVMKFGLEGRRPFDLCIPGRHNQLNAQAAYCAASLLGVSWEEAQFALTNFTGLPHRLELVLEEKGVRFINDSIATIPEAAIAAMESFPAGKVIQIIGGEEHNLPIDALCKALMDRAKAVLCIGDTTPKLMAELTRYASSSTAPIFDSGTLAAAVTKAKQIAAVGDVVLLSTGYKSFDQFNNFEDRGNTFKRLCLMPVE